MKQLREYENPLNRTWSYLSSLHDAQVLRHAHETISVDERRGRIVDLMQTIPNTQESNIEAIGDLYVQIRTLLRSDPLTDQQAGILTRWIWEARYPFEDIYQSSILAFPLDELVELRAGDWSTVERICTQTPEREQAWEKVTAEALPEDQDLTVYRGMRLEKDDIKKIRQFGILPPGLWRYQTFNAVLHRKLQYDLGRASRTGYFATEEWEQHANLGILLDLPFSKSAILRNHWLVDPDGAIAGVDTPDSIAISTTPHATLETAKRYGNYVVELNLPTKYLVPRWAEQSMIDYTVLYYIPPSAIQGISEVRNRW